MHCQTRQDWRHRWPARGVRWWLIAVVLLASGRADALMTVAVELRALPKVAYQQYQILPLYRKLLVRLTEAGFAVVGSQHTSKVRILLQSTPSGLRVIVRGAGQQVVKLVPKSQETIPQYHLEVLHKSLTATRQLQARMPKPVRATPMRPRPPPKRGLVAKGVRLRKKRKALPPEQPVRWRAEIDLGGFFMYRIQATDFLARLGFRWGQERGFGLYTSLSLAPALNEQITIIEWGLQVGPTWRQPIVDAFSLEFGLLAGFVHHRYYFGQGDAAQGNRWDFLGTLLLMGNWQIARRVGFRVWLGLGLSFQSRLHVLNGATIWERSLFRLEGGGAFYLSF